MLNIKTIAFVSSPLSPFQTFISYRRENDKRTLQNQQSLLTMFKPIHFKSRWKLERKLNPSRLYTQPNSCRRVKKSILSNRVLFVCTKIHSTMITYVLSLESTIDSRKTGQISSQFENNLKCCGYFFKTFKIVQNLLIYILLNRKFNS